MYFTILNKKKVVVKKVAIEITKKLPEVPAAFSAKANQFDAEGAKVVEVTDATWNLSLIHSLNFTIAFDESDRTTYGSMSETVVTDENDANYDDFIENSSFTYVVTVSYDGATATVSNDVDRCV